MPPRKAVAADAAQILTNLSWIDNAPREDKDSIAARLEVPGTIAVIDPDSKAVMMGQVYPEEPGVKVIWWVGPPESHMKDLMVALTGFVEEVLREYPMARPWRFYGDTPSEVLANRWVDEVKEPGGQDIVAVRTSPNNERQFEGESTIGEVWNAVRGGA